MAKRGVHPLDATWSGALWERVEDHLSTQEILTSSCRLGKGGEGQTESSPGAMVGSRGGLVQEQEEAEDYAGDGGLG